MEPLAQAPRIGRPRKAATIALWRHETMKMMEGFTCVALFNLETGLSDFRLKKTRVASS